MPRKLFVVTLVVLAAIFIAPAAASAQGGPPCIPSPSIPPTFGTGCGQVERTPDLHPALSVDSMKFPVEPPVAAQWGYAGYSVAHFDVPRQSGIGVVRIGAFISARELLPARFGVVGYGNDRSFDENFDARRTKLTLELNFTTGEGTAWADPSCAYLVDAIGQRTPTLCHSALPLDGSDSGSQLLIGSIRNADGTISFEAKYSAKQSFTEGVPGVRSTFPRISGDLTTVLGADGSVCLNGRVDQFPSVEAYLYRPDGGRVEELYRSTEVRWGPEIGLSPILSQKPVLACTDPV